MTATQRLQLRQGPSLTLTPQLLQSIGLLQLSHQELSAYVAAELERNPLLRQEDAPEEASPPIPDRPATAARDETIRRIFPQAFRPRPVGAGGGRGSVNGEAVADLDATVSETPSLAGHLEAQLPLAAADPDVAEAARHLIHSLDEAGYLAEDLSEIAARLRRPPSLLEEALSLVQELDPPGIGARDLAECLRLQLREREALDRPMEILLTRLDLVARGDLAGLARACGIDREGLNRLLAALRRLDPKPGLAFAPSRIDPLLPDVLVTEAPDGTLAVALNPRLLPRVLLDKDTYARVAPKARGATDRDFLTECLQSAQWLTRSLERRAATILAVAAVILRRQKGFFRNGIVDLQPLTLRDVAQETGLHESTVSRVAANKALGTNRGTYPLRFFFGEALQGLDGRLHAAKAVRHRIGRILAQEEPRRALSDEAIAQLLKADGILIARRTVAKYREILRVPPSPVRRRQAKGACRAE